MPGPGLGGFTLGGGYSWKTNSYGLTIDTVKSFTLILPNGTITTVDSSTPDLFFALRGGLNRFGVVADAELYTHEQVPLIYGGTRLYGGNEVDRIINATSQFEATNTDPKATVITSILGSGLGATATTQFFYDGPQKPASFQVFDGISTLLIDSVKTQKFSDFVASIPSDLRKPTNFRGYWETFSTTGTTLRFLQALKKEAVVGCILSWLRVRYGADVNRRGWESCQERRQESILPLTRTFLACMALKPSTILPFHTLIRSFR